MNLDSIRNRLPDYNYRLLANFLGALFAMPLGAFLALSGVVLIVLAVLGKMAVSLLLVFGAAALTAFGIFLMLYAYVWVTGGV